MTDAAPKFNGGHAVSKPREGAPTRLGSLPPVSALVAGLVSKPGKKGASKRLAPLGNRSMQYERR